MSCAVRPSGFVLCLFLVISGFTQFSVAQRGSAPTPRTGTTVLPPVPDFSRAPDPTGQSQLRFQPYDKKPLTFTSKPTYVLVPVVVTGKDGKPVAGLRKEDFQLEENGKDQKIASVEEIKTSAAPAFRPATARNEVTNQASTDATPRRLVIIALDMVNTPFLDQTRARKSMISYLSQNVETGALYQLVAIENNGLRVLHDYSQDPASLIAAVKAVESRFSTGNNVDTEAVRGASTDTSLTTVPTIATTIDTGVPEVSALTDFINARAESAYSQRRSADAASSTLLAFQQIAERASGIPGRKSLVWITASFPFSIDPASASVDSGLSFAAYQHTMQVLQNQLISVYPVDIRGLVITSPDASMHLSAKENAQFANLIRDQSNRLIDTLDTMRAFADMTGGHAYINTNDTAGAIRDAAQDGVDYYMLSYPVDKSDRRPGWRKINVKVGDYHVRARRGYFLTATTIDPQVTAGYDMENALKSPFDYTGLPLRVVLEPPVLQGDKRKVTFAMLMPPKAASVDNTDNNHLHVDIAYAVWSASGQDAAHKGTSYNLRLNPTQLQAVDTKGLSYGDTVELPPGAYRLCVVVRDNLTGQIGSVQAPLELK